MQNLPREILAQILERTPSSGRTMLALTCKTLRKRVQEKYTLNVLYCCICDGTRKQIELAESWGNKWYEKSYFALGVRGDLDFLKEKMIGSVFGFQRIKLNDEQIREIYHGACYAGQTDILDWLYVNYHAKAHFRGYPFSGPKRTACGGQ